MNRTPWRGAVAAVSAVVVATALASCSAFGSGHSGGTQGQVPGAGDSYYPELGNPGYDAEHYTLDLAVDPVRGSLSGTAVIQARAAQALTRLPILTYAPTALAVQTQLTFAHLPAMQALRLRVDDPVFFRILRTYAAEHRFGNATTAGFIADAEKVSGQDLRAFFSTWLYKPAAPPMPPLLPTQ